MKFFKRLCACLAFIWTLSPMMTACEYLPIPSTPIHSDSTDDIENSSEDSLPDTENNSTESDGNSSTDSTTKEEEETFDPLAESIMDSAYALAVGEALDGTHELSGVITEIDLSYTSKNGVCLYMRVAEPKHRELYCFRLKGTGADVIAVGDTITVSGTIKNYKGLVEFDKNCTLVSWIPADDSEKPDPTGDPYQNVSRSEFYADYTPATSNEDAYYRSLHGFLSGSLTVPDQAPILAETQPKQDGLFVRNEHMLFDESGKEYTVVDVYGNEAFKVYEDGAYITLEEVAAYVYAFGTYPKNYTVSKDTTPSQSIWQEYLRVNHTSFSGNTSRYPYEPKLPNISGCGGSLRYYEMDIGTTGTDCDPNYTARLYNDGNSITRGAARIVYGKNDLNGNGIYERGEFHVFYTYNHYNDFQEYLNYVGGWGEMFGNITGGGTISSKTDYAPTDYVEVCFGNLPTLSYASFATRKNASKLPYSCL